MEGGGRHADTVSRGLAVGQLPSRRMVCNGKGNCKVAKKCIDIGHGRVATHETAVGGHVASHCQRVGGDGDVWKEAKRA